MRGEREGSPLAQTFLFRVEQRESDAQPYASFSWKFLTAVPATPEMKMDP
jgi:hypothetical protein